REDVRDWDFESYGEHVEARENIFGRRFGPSCSRYSAEVVCIQIDEIKDSFLIKLIRVIKLSGNNPPAIRKRVYVLVHERLVEKTDFAARRLTGVITLERTETIHKTVCLRSVIIWQDGKILCKDSFIGGRMTLPKWCLKIRTTRQAGNLHGFCPA